MISKITQSEIDRNAVAALSDRPGAPGRYGTGGLSSGQLKAHFDKLALLAIAKLNELIDALHGAGQGDPLIDEMTTHAVSLADDRENMPLSDWIGQVAAVLGLDGTGGLPARIAALEALRVPDETPAAVALSGYHPDLVAGLAENLCGRENDETGAYFTHRPTREAGDVGRGNAVLRSLHGSTLLWNQLAQNGDFADVAWWGAYQGSLSVSGRVGHLIANGAARSLSIRSYAIPYVTGHKYLTAFDLYTTADCKGGVYCFGAVDYNLSFSANTWVRRMTVLTAADNSEFGIYPCQNTSGRAPVAGEVFDVKNVILIDLTRMFGAGREPTAAEFNKLFPLPYYNYDSGRLLHFNGDGLATVGFNQWDGTGTDGQALGNSGGTYPSATQFATGYIRVFGGADYYLDANDWASWVDFYDADKVYIGQTSRNTDGVVHVPVRAMYARLTGTLTHKAEACFNLSHSGWRNGEYEPYRESTLDLPVAAYFPTGMKSVGAVFDELTEKKAVQRVGTRAYAAGDESDSSVVTDGTTTCYVLDEPVETEVDLTFTYRADDFGTEKLLPENGAAPTTSPLTGRIMYPLNAVDTVRNLPRNYVSLATFDKLRAALAPYFTVTRAWNAATGDYNVSLTQVGGVWKHAVSIKNSDDEWLWLDAVTGSAAAVAYNDGESKFTGLADGAYAAYSEDHGAGTAVVSGGVMTFHYGSSDKVWNGAQQVRDAVTKLY